MGEDTGKSQGGGVNISGVVGSVGGDIVGGNKVTVESPPSLAALDGAFRPVLEAIGAVPGEKQADAEVKLAALKAEIAKGKDAKDTTIAKLLEGLVALVPSAIKAIGTGVGGPILGAVAGPATKYVIEKFEGASTEDA